jgi:hypothetical protein
MEENVKVKGNDIGLAHVITVRLLGLLNQANTEQRQVLQGVKVEVTVGECLVCRELLSSVGACIFCKGISSARRFFLAAGSCFTAEGSGSSKTLRSW